MNTSERISSILRANTLDSSVTGIPSFELSNLFFSTSEDSPLPNNLRLGHLAEKVVSGALKSSDKYRLLFENLQVKEGNVTIGEIDFIVEEVASNDVIHFELAYKFYLLYSMKSALNAEGWIGPNRKDSLCEKLEKLKAKQFPLLHRPNTKVAAKGVDLSKASQQLCFMVSLYVPHNFEPQFHPVFTPAIKGRYMSYDVFMSLHSANSQYYLPQKKEWGMRPAERNQWQSIQWVGEKIQEGLAENQSVLCWVKNDTEYSEVFVVWW